MLDRHIRLNDDKDIDVHYFHKIVKPMVRAPRLHCHDSFEIAYFLDGEGEYTVGGRIYQICRGDAFLFGSYEPHYITRIEEGTTLHTLNLHFTRSLLCSNDDSVLDNSYFRFFLDRDDHFSNRIPCGTAINREILTFMQRCEQLFDQSPEEIILALKPMAATLLNDLRVDAHLPASGNAAVRLNRRFQTVCQFMIDHYNQPLTLEQIAASVNMSKAYFSTQFKRMNGISPWDYLQIQRVRHALILIADTDMTMLDIALKCGFNNTANFNRAFLKVTGKTPKSYRKRVAETE